MFRGVLRPDLDHHRRDGVEEESWADTTQVRPDRRNRRGRRAHRLLDRRARPRGRACGPLSSRRSQAVEPGVDRPCRATRIRSGPGATVLNAVKAAFGPRRRHARAATRTAPRDSDRRDREEAGRQAGEHRPRLRLDADPPLGDASLYREGQAARRHDSDLRGVRRLRGDDGPSRRGRWRSTRSSRSISTSSPRRRRARGWSSTATRTTRRPPTSARARRASSSREVNRESPDTTILVDEAYFDYVTDPDHDTHIPIAVENPRVIVARTFSKAYGMAGHAHGLRGRPRGHDQEDGRLGRRRRAPAR